jgi:hypothetical protein
VKPSCPNGSVGGTPHGPGGFSRCRTAAFTLQLGRRDRPVASGSLATHPRSIVHVPSPDSRPLPRANPTSKTLDPDPRATARHRSSPVGPARRPAPNALP